VPGIPALKRLRQENLELKASLGYMVRACLQKQNKTTKQVQSFAIDGLCTLLCPAFLGTALVCPWGDLCYPVLR
jgi:hypothetical protein